VVKQKAFPPHQMEKLPGSGPKGMHSAGQPGPLRATKMKGRVKVHTRPSKPPAGLSFSQQFLRGLNHMALHKIQY